MQKYAERQGTIMTLRRATMNDFEACRRLSDDCEADVLYDNRQEAEESEMQDNPQKSYFSEKDMKHIRDELELTIEKFERCFDDEYGIIYVFEDDENRIIAYVKLDKMVRYKWKLTEMQIEKIFQTNDIFIQILNSLISQKEIKEINVCTTMEFAQKNFLIAGYKPINPILRGYFRKTT